MSYGLWLQREARRRPCRQVYLGDKEGSAEIQRLQRF